jgi:hypothetical protein
MAIVLEPTHDAIVGMSLLAIAGAVAEITPAPRPTEPGGDRHDRRVADTRLEGPIKRFDARVRISPVGKVAHRCPRKTSVVASRFSSSTGLIRLRCSLRAARRSKRKHGKPPDQAALRPGRWSKASRPVRSQREKSAPVT